MILVVPTIQSSRQGLLALETGGLNNVGSTESLGTTDVTGFLFRRIRQSASPRINIHAIACPRQLLDDCADRLKAVVGDSGAVLAIRSRSSGFLSVDDLLVLVCPHEPSLHIRG